MNIVKKEYKAPMWKVIVDELVDELRRSDLPEGSAFYSIEELAEKYSVSSITSRRVLNELESNGLISKARGRNAVILRPNPLRKVVLIDPADCLQNRPDYGYICMAVYRGIIEELARRGIESTVINPRHFERFDFSQPHDVIVLPEYNRLPLGLRKEMRENPLLNVVVPHALEPIPGIPTIGSDLRGEADSVVSHLIEQGARRVAIIQTAPDYWNELKFLGYTDALKRHGIAFDLHLASQVEYQSMDSLYLTLDHLLMSDKRPDAIFCVNDRIAASVADYCTGHGVTIPQDLLLAGFDNLPEATRIAGGLTTVDSGWLEQGRMAVRLLAERCRHDEARHVSLDIQLVVRNSSVRKLSL